MSWSRSSIKTRGPLDPHYMAAKSVLRGHHKGKGESRLCSGRCMMELIGLEYTLISAPDAFKDSYKCECQDKSTASLLFRRFLLRHLLLDDFICNLLDALCTRSLWSGRVRNSHILL